jgi:nicotinamide-nucleotide amidase
MRAEIIATGTEILLGEIADTNTSFLAGQLASLGIDLYFVSSVGDNLERLSGVLRLAWQRSELILTTGGLGPTQGDITREAIAGLLGESLQIDPRLRENIAKFFAERGQEMSPNNAKQAAIIPSATAIPNPLGTAPGWWVEKEGRIIIAMPGPPGEMQPMWKSEVAPRLQTRADATILSRTLKTLGLAESRIDELLAHLLSSSNPTLASYAKADGIYLRITAKAGRREEAQAMISSHEAAVRAVLGDDIWGVDDETLEALVGEILVDRGLSLAVAESFTGGSLMSTLARAPQYRLFFRGGWLTTSDEAKAALGLDPGLMAGSTYGAATAAAMASLVRGSLKASIGIGIEGAESADNVKMGKVFIAIDSPLTERPQVRSHSGRLNQVIGRAAYHALFDLKKLLTST